MTLTSHPARLTPQREVKEMSLFLLPLHYFNMDSRTYIVYDLVLSPTAGNEDELGFSYTVLMSY